MAEEESLYDSMVRPRLVHEGKPLVNEKEIQMWEEGEEQLGTDDNSWKTAHDTGNNSNKNAGQNLSPTKKVAATAAAALEEVTFSSSASSLTRAANTEAITKGTTTTTRSSSTKKNQSFYHTVVGVTTTKATTPLNHSSSRFEQPQKCSKSLLERYSNHGESSSMGVGIRTEDHYHSPQQQQHEHEAAADNGSSFISYNNNQQLVGNHVSLQKKLNTQHQQQEQQQRAQFYHITIGASQPQPQQDFTLPPTQQQQQLNYHYDTHGHSHLKTHGHHATHYESRKRDREEEESFDDIMMRPRLIHEGKPLVNDKEIQAWEEGEEQLGTDDDPWNTADETGNCRNENACHNLLPSKNVATTVAVAADVPFSSSSSSLTRAANTAATTKGTETRSGSKNKNQSFYRTVVGATTTTATTPFDRSSSGFEQPQQCSKFLRGSYSNDGESSSMGVDIMMEDHYQSPQQQHEHEAPADNGSSFISWSSHQRLVGNQYSPQQQLNNQQQQQQQRAQLYHITVGASQPQPLQDFAFPPTHHHQQQQNHHYDSRGHSQLEAHGYHFEIGGGEGPVLSQQHEQYQYNHSPPTASPAPPYSSYLSSNHCHPDFEVGTQPPPSVERMEGVVQDISSKGPLVVIDGANVAYAYAEALGDYDYYGGGRRLQHLEPNVKGIEVACDYFAHPGVRVLVVLHASYLKRKPQRFDQNNDNNNSLMESDHWDILQRLKGQGKLVLAPPTDDDDAYVLTITYREHMRRIQHGNGNGDGGNSNNHDVHDYYRSDAYCLSNDLYRDAQERHVEYREWLKRGGDARISFAFVDMGQLDDHGQRLLDIIPNPKHKLVAWVEKQHHHYSRNAAVAKIDTTPIQPLAPATPMPPPSFAFQEPQQQPSPSSMQLIPFPLQPSFQHQGGWPSG